MQSGEYMWLASYPKSGNTWVRLLLGNLLGLKETDGEDEDVFSPVAGISSHRWPFHRYVGMNSFELTNDEIDAMRPGVYRMIAKNTPGINYMKAHDAFGRLPNGDPFFPADCSRGALYMVRDPLDVAVSYAHHRGEDGFEKTVKAMNNPHKTMAGGRNEQLLQFMGTWSDHYRSWTEQQDIPVCVVRYEDLRADTVSELARIVDFIGIEQSSFAKSIEEAVQASRFDRLQKIEDNKGFAEKPIKAKRFFRSGRSGEGRETLSEELQSELIACHADVMRELGYLEREQSE